MVFINQGLDQWDLRVVYCHGNKKECQKPASTGAADFAKGNRFFSGKAYGVMPKLRFLGTAFLSLLTKIVSGYWHLSDFQSGYVAISKKALETVNWQQMYKRYGQPNDQLILLNVYNFRVQDVPVDPVYHVGDECVEPIHGLLLRHILTHPNTGQRVFWFQFLKLHHPALPISQPVEKLYSTNRLFQAE
jgi:hypothetical protein